MNFDLQTWVQIGTLVATIAGFITIFVSIRIYRRQLNLQVVMQYAERYEKIVDSFPEEAIGVRFNLDKELPPASTKLTLAVLKYLNLCSEEYYLCKKRYLHKDVWNIWEDDLKRWLQSPLVRREWKTLRCEFDRYDEFTKYVERIMSDPKAAPVPSEMETGSPEYDHSSLAAAD